jgi:hypothetical protein
VVTAVELSAFVTLFTSVTVPLPLSVLVVVLAMVLSVFVGFVFFLFKEG